jgi:hypothetical protein
MFHEMVVTFGCIISSELVHHLMKGFFLLVLRRNSQSIPTYVNTFSSQEALINLYCFVQSLWYLRSINVISQYLEFSINIEKSH